MAIEVPSCQRQRWRSGSLARSRRSRIVALYDVLLTMIDNPMARLARAIALTMVGGAAAGLAAVEQLARDHRIAGSYRLDAVRGHLHERAGDRATAVTSYRRAADATTSTPERNYLLLKAARLDEA